MSVISIQRTHQFSLEELREKIDKIINEISKKLELFSEWESDKILLFRRKGVNGCIEIDNNNFELTLRLGMMYRMLKGSIENEVTEVVNGYIK